MLRRAISRREALKGALALGTATGLAAAGVDCGPTEKPVPAQVSPATEPAATPTHEITWAMPPTPEPTKVLPALEGFPGLPQPQPSLLQTSIEQYAKAMGIPKEAVQPAYREFKDYRGRQFVVSLDSSTDAPLLLADRDEGQANIWREATLKALGEKRNLPFGTNLASAIPGSLEFRRMQELQGTEFGVYGAVNTKTSLIEPPTIAWGMQQARLKNMPILIHPVLWGSVVSNSLQGKSRSELTDIGNAFVSAFVTQISEYPTVGQPVVVLVNEYGRRDDLFYNIIGPDYPDIFLQTARKINASPLYIVNSFDNHTVDGGIFGNQFQATKNLTDRLAAKGLIDGVGIEFLIDGANPPKPEAVVATLPLYRLPVYITEFSVIMTNVRGSKQERFMKQAKVYEEMTGAAIKSGVCKVFMDFQVGDKFSIWEYSATSMSGPDADCTPYDDDLTPKPALYAQRRALLLAA